MTITRHQVEDVTVLCLKGRLILYDGDLLLRQRIDELLASGDTRVVLDLQGIDYIDSAGIGMLVSKYLTVRRAGGTIKILHPNERTDHLMDITKLTTVFEIYQDEDAALRSFGRADEGV